MHVRWRYRCVFLPAAILAACVFAPVATASSLTLTSDPSANMAPQCPGGYLSSMQQGDATPPAVNTRCGLYTMTGAGSLTGTFAAPSDYGTVVASAYIRTVDRATTLSEIVDGSQVGPSITPTSGTQWWSFPAVSVTPSDTVQIKLTFGVGSQSNVYSLHAEFAVNSTATLIQANMTQPDEQLPEGVPCGYDWSGCDGTHTGAIVHYYNPTTGANGATAHGYHYLDPWGQAYNAKTGNPAPADRVEVRGLQEWYLSQASNVWWPVYTMNGGYGFAPAPTVTASASTGCSIPSKVIDGLSLGAPTYPCNEWASGQGAGAWIKLTWPSPQTLTHVELFDRPNLNDQITAGNLVLSDGTTVPFGPLNNDGSATNVPLPQPTSTTSVKVDVTGVSGTTTSAGLDEVQPVVATNPAIGGALYNEDFSGSAICAKLDTSTDPGSTMASPSVDCNGNQVAGKLYHFFNSRVYTSSPADIKAVVAAVQMRLAPTNPPGDGVNYVGNIGADVWGCSSGCSSVDGMGESRFETLGANWRTMLFDSSQNPSADPPPPLLINGQPIPPSELH